MKRKLPFWLPILVACSALVAYIFAQQPTPTITGSQLTNGIALFNEGKPQQAREVFLSIGADSPDYGLGQCYGVLCQYEYDKWGFMTNVGSLTVHDAIITPEVREDLDYKEVDVLFFYRRFEELLPKVRAFQTEHSDSTRLDSVREYQMAGLFERGMKKIYEASKLASGTNSQFNTRLADGKTNLQEFVSVALSFDGTNYNVIPKHVLKEDLWVARMALGESNSVLNEISIGDTAARERLNLLRVRLFQKLRRDQVDQNIEMMNDFITEFPSSRSRKRVEFDLASLSFHEGEKLAKEAEALEHVGDGLTASEKRTSASNYFQLGRSLQTQAIVDQESNIEASDIRDLQEDVLCSHFWEKDFSTLAAQTSSMISTSAPGSLDWVLAKVFDGVRLVCQPQPNVENATTIFDEVLALNLKGKPDHDRLVSVAARWRINIALKARDKAKAKEIAQWLRDSNCTSDIKETFLKDYPGMIKSTTSSSEN